MHKTLTNVPPNPGMGPMTWFSINIFRATGTRLDPSICALIGRVGTVSGQVSLTPIMIITLITVLSCSPCWSASGTAACQPGASVPASCAWPGSASPSLSTRAGPRSLCSHLSSLHWTPGPSASWTTPRPCWSWSSGQWCHELLKTIEILE